MINLYIDESGSMTRDYKTGDHNFIIAIIYAKDKKLLQKAYKYFIKKNFDDLKKSDTSHKMFREEKFIELKGSAMTMDLKKKFMMHMNRGNSFEIFYIISDNRFIEEKFYKNTARAFNYLLKIALIFLMRRNYLPKNEEFDIQIDERNIRTGAKQLLQEYLNTELQLEASLTEKEVKVSYFDSANNHLIQIADVFSNICYSQLYNHNYTEEIKKLKNTKILRYVFTFPKGNKIDIEY